MVYRTIKCALPVVILAVAVSACSSRSTNMTGSWIDEDYDGGPIESVLIIAIVSTEEGRTIFENEFAEKLRRHGVEATTSFDLMGAETELTAENIIAAWNNTDIEAVLVSSLEELETQTYQEPHIPYASSDAHTYIDQQMTTRRSDRPGDVFVSLKTSLYTHTSEEAVWSALTETFSASSVHEVAAEKVELLVAELLSRGLIE